MQLFFLRHGPAELRSEWSGAEADRPLTVKGTRRVEGVAQRLVGLHVEPDVILTSPYARAAQTAQIVGEITGLGERIVEESLLRPGFGMSELRTILENRKDAGSLMFVGHEPDFSEVVGELIGGGNVQLRKAGIAQVDTDPSLDSVGTLVWLAQPERIDP